MKFRKRPVVVDASQWLKNGDHPQDYVEDQQGFEDGELRTSTGAERKANDWEGGVVRYFRHPDVGGETACRHCGVRMHAHGWIDTLEGGHIVCPGDWVITGVKGERYPCKPDIFTATYELADEVAAAGAQGAERTAALRGIADSLGLPLGSDLMTFGAALERLKAGARVARAGWNGKGQFAYLVPAASYPVQTGAAAAHFGAGSLVPYRAYLALKTVDDTVSTWAPSVSDVLAEDWIVVA